MTEPVEEAPVPTQEPEPFLCEVCGCPLTDRGAGHRKKVLHEDCKNLKKFLAAAARAAEAIGFQKGVRGTLASELRSQALRLANRIPPEPYLKRGDGGRFVPKA